MDTQEETFQQFTLQVATKATAGPDCWSWSRALHPGFPQAAGAQHPDCPVVSFEMREQKGESQDG